MFAFGECVAAAGPLADLKLVDVELGVPPVLCRGVGKPLGQGIEARVATPRRGAVAEKGVGHTCTRADTGEGEVSGAWESFRR